MSHPILSVTPLEFVWKTADPFLFCVHHLDAYPSGNDALGPAKPLNGRSLGQDFGGKDGWNMYHGRTVPGFPQHPHRGFETITFVRRGVVDHADSLGAAGRYGDGDAQWMTAGKGIQHAEMFPLLQADEDNPLELFQIWLNLPHKDKMADPHYTMLWREQVPQVRMVDSEGNATVVTVVAGQLGEHLPPPPPPKSVASNPDNDLAIWTIRLEGDAQWVVPETSPETNRTLYFFDGDTLSVADQEVPPRSGLVVRADEAITLRAGPDGAELVMLQGRPIGEPVAQQGPFVMNTHEEIQQAFADYRATEFGGWPWDRPDPNHGPTEGRFARHADGRIERP